MSFAVAAVAAELTEHALPIPPFTYGVIAAIGFVLLGVVTWSFKDVAHRHAPNSDPNAGDHYAGAGASSHASGHGGN